MAKTITNINVVVALDLEIPLRLGIYISLATSLAKVRSFGSASPSAGLRKASLTGFFDQLS